MCNLRWRSSFSRNTNMHMPCWAVVNAGKHCSRSCYKITIHAEIVSIHYCTTPEQAFQTHEPGAICQACEYTVQVGCQQNCLHFLGCRSNWATTPLYCCQFSSRDKHAVNRDPFTSETFHTPLPTDPAPRPQPSTDNLLHYASEETAALYNRCCLQVQSECRTQPCGRRAARSTWQYANE